MVKVFSSLLQTSSSHFRLSRIPFYHTLKMIFLLYIALPQLQGSSYLYRSHLQPFFRSHESQIDSTLARMKARLYAFLQQRMRMVWDQASGIATGQAAPTSAVSRELEEDDRVGAVPPPSLANPVGGPMALASSLWASYGPGLIASGVALMSERRPVKRVGVEREGSFEEVQMPSEPED
jgi:receptor expression-enhancing protein 1/2/3/4